MKYQALLIGVIALAAMLPVPLEARPMAPTRITWIRHSVGGHPLLYESKNGRLLVIETDEDSASGSTLQLWNARTGRREAIIKPSTGHTLPDVLQVLALSDDGTRLLARRLVGNTEGIYESQLEFWTSGSAPTRRATRTEDPADMALDAVATANPGGWKLLLASAIETLDASGKSVARAPLQATDVSPWGAFASDASRAVLSAGPTVFDGVGHKVISLPLQGGLSVGFEFSPDARLLVVARRQILHSPSHIRTAFELWDLKTPLPTRLNVPVAGEQPLWSSDGRAVLGSDGRFRIARTGKVAAFQIAWPPTALLTFETAQMSRDGKTLAVADSAGNVWLGAR